MDIFRSKDLLKEFVWSYPNTSSDKVLIFFYYSMRNESKSKSKNSFYVRELGDAEYLVVF